MKRTMCTSNKSESKKASVLETDLKIPKRKRTVVEKRQTSQIAKNITKKKTSVVNKRQTAKNGKKQRNTIIRVKRSTPEVETESNPAVLASAMNRAREVQASLSPQFPSLVKPMTKSHVVRGFWLSLDKAFCVAHLPARKDKVYLVDEKGEEFKTEYLEHGSHSFGLSGGWRGFAITKGLLVDDVLIFQLVKPRMLKVHIITAETATELDSAAGLLNLNPHVEPMEQSMDTDQDEASEHSQETESQTYDEPLSPDSYKHKYTLMLIDNYDPAMDELDIDYDNGSNTEVVEGVEFSQRDVNFRNVKRSEDFTIQVDGQNLDSKIPPGNREKYYELCSSRKVLLHENLTKGLICDLYIAVISQTINIADAIKEVKYSKELISDLKIWDTALASFESLGMEVGFLRARISKLLGLYQKYQECQAELELKQRERDGKEDEMRCVKEQLCSIQETTKKLESEVHKFGSEVMELATSPW